MVLLRAEMALQCFGVVLLICVCFAICCSQRSAVVVFWCLTAPVFALYYCSTSKYCLEFAGTVLLFNVASRQIGVLLVML